MANSAPLAHLPVTPAVNPTQAPGRPNRPLESRLDRMMFASLGSRPALLLGFE